MRPQSYHISGHVWLYRGKRGDTWYAKVRGPVRLADGRTVTKQTQEKIGPAWSGRGRPPEGHHTRRTAEAWLAARLTDLRRGVGVRVEGADVTFREAAEAWYGHGEHEAGWKPHTRRDYRSALNAHLLPAFGDVPLHEITPRRIDAWRSAGMADGRLPRRTANKVLAIVHGVLERAKETYGLELNAAASVKRVPDRYDPSRYDFYSPEEVHALVRAAAGEADGAFYLAAAFTGLRPGEILALRIRDVDFEGESIRALGSVDAVEGIGTTKTGRGRTVPMVPEVAAALARLLQRERFTARDDLVFAGETGSHLDLSALRRRFRDAQKRADLRPIRLYDLRHTFGSLAVRRMDVVEVQAYMGHSKLETTRRYLHYKPRLARRLVSPRLFESRS